MLRHGCIMIKQIHSTVEFLFFEDFNVSWKGMQSHYIQLDFNRWKVKLRRGCIRNRRSFAWKGIQSHYIQWDFKRWKVMLRQGVIRYRGGFACKFVAINQKSFSNAWSEY